MNSSTPTTAQRFDVREPASIEVYGKGTNIVAVLTNLSSTGARLSWESGANSLEKGDLVCVTIHLHKLNKQHRVSAEVVWQNGKETGVNFIPPEQLFAKFREKTQKRN